MEPARVPGDRNSGIREHAAAAAGRLRIDPGRIGGPAATSHALDGDPFSCDRLDRIFVLMKDIFE